MPHLRNTTIRLCLLVLVSGIQLFAQRAREIYNGREVASNEVVIRLKDPNSGLVNVLSSMLPNRLRPRFLTRIWDWCCVHSPTRPVAALIDLFANQGDLSYVEPNFTVQAAATPNDPYLGQLWGLQSRRRDGRVGYNSGKQLLSVVGIVDYGRHLYPSRSCGEHLERAPAAFGS